MKKTIATLILALFSITLTAQSGDDACRFSQNFYQGTAKAMGMGNAMGAVGGDMTAICINPAGMGLYRSSELAASINFSDNYNTSTYYGTEANGNKISVSLPNIGYVYSREKSNYKPLRYSQFCISLTRTNDYNMHTYASGYNPTSSKIDEYLNQIGGCPPNELYNYDYFRFTVLPAWDTYLIDTINGIYTSPVPQGGIIQNCEQEYKGRTEEWTLGYSANFNDRLFVGFSLAIPFLKRVGSRVYQEVLPDTSNIQTDFKSFCISEDLSSTGMGVNAKIGLIWHANRWLRLGAAFHTPSVYHFTESWQPKTESHFTNAYYPNPYITISNYEYYYYSPAKWVGSTAFVFSDRGMVSLDAEYVDYGTAFFEATDDYDYSQVNEDIKQTYSRTFNLRIGTEWYVNGSYLRLGAGYYGSPFGFGQPNGSIKKASAGISVPVNESITFDLAYELSHGKRLYTLYDAGALGIEPVTQKQFRSVALATLKYRF